MSDVIQLLPESIANQIHAGEVVQRPSSVVKELVENAIDAGASQIKVNIKDAGRTLIQVIDNGCGMSETDARMAFELHATSKIKTTDDLYNIRTMGFRGEALAAISIVADVELRTKQESSDSGTFIHIVGSKVITQECVQCGIGSNFMVKNLFFNTSARRKFLKKDATELKHIISEIQRIALANPLVGLSFIHNGDTIYDLLQGDNLVKRISAIFGKGSNQKLIPVETETSIINIKGFVGQPKYARKRYGEQFFFINGRYMRHVYFNKAISIAFEKLLPPDAIPSYFLFLTTDPQRIDVNVSPNKTEVKFENEKDIWHILIATIRESLGKFNVMPSIDFNQIGSVEIPVATKNTSKIEIPSIAINPTYNPFESSKTSKIEPTKVTIGSKMNTNTAFNSTVNTKAYTVKSRLGQEQEWNNLYSNFENTSETVKPDIFNVNLENNILEASQDRRSFQLKGKYIVSPVKSGLMLINQQRAHERILYEKYIGMLSHTTVASQQLLFPQILSLSTEDSAILATVADDLKLVGFNIEDKGDGEFAIIGIPAILDASNVVSVLENTIVEIKDNDIDLREKATEKIAESLAIASAISSNKILQNEEQNQLIDQLFVCSMPNYTPRGKLVLTILSADQIANLFS